MDDGGIFGWLHHLFGPYAIVLQVLALIHAIRRRAEFFWYWIIFMGGGLGAAIYFVLELMPDMSMVMSRAMASSHRKKRIQALELAIHDNPSPANFEELGELYLDEQQPAQARDSYTKAIQARSDSLHTFYSRAKCTVAMGDHAGAIDDLEHVVSKDPKFDYLNAAGLLARVYAHTGRTDAANEWFREVAQGSDSLETLYHYAKFLQGQERRDEAGALAEKMLEKRRGMPRFQQRRDRPWFDKAKTLLKELRAGAATG
jgi:hypothetical protein